jgi:hypothetical protein
MSHEILNQLGVRRRQLLNRDASRYQTLKLVIQRSRPGKAVVSLVYTDVGGHRLQDTRLAAAEIDTHDAQGEALRPGPLLRNALRALHLE